MKLKNTSIPFGPIVLIDKINKDYNLFKHIFQGLGENIGDFQAYIKLFLYNKLVSKASLHQIKNIYPEELYKRLGFKKEPSERQMYRVLDKVGCYFQIITKRYHEFVLENNLLSYEQIFDWSSVFFYGDKPEITELGYSRDHRPDKKQITIGLGIGANNIPSILTIQKGNVLDKVHFKNNLKMIKGLFPKGTLLIFDCGANTKENVNKITTLGYDYITLKAKHLKTYKKYVDIFFREKCLEDIEINGNKYVCVKIKKEKKYEYIFFSQKLKETQIKNKEKKFDRNIKNNDKKLKKFFLGKEIEKKVTSKGYLILKGILQTGFGKLKNPYINGIEGFFILEASIDKTPKKIWRFIKKEMLQKSFLKI